MYMHITQCILCNLHTCGSLLSLMAITPRKVRRQIIDTPLRRRSLNRMPYYRIFSRSDCMPHALQQVSGCHCSNCSTDPPYFVVLYFCQIVQMWSDGYTFLQFYSWLKLHVLYYTYQTVAIGTRYFNCLTVNHSAACH